MSYKLGDRVSMIPQTFGTGIAKPGDSASHTKNALRHAVKPLSGVVTYIHPKGRWYQVTFDCGVRECFFVDVEPSVEKKRGRPALPNGYCKGA